MACSLRQHLAVMAGGQRGLDGDLLQLETQLGESAGLDAPRLPLLELGQRPTSPQREALGRDVPDAFVLAQRQELLGSPGLAVELADVDRVGGQAQAVAVC